MSNFLKNLMHYLFLLAVVLGLGYVSWYINKTEEAKVDLGQRLPLFEISEYHLIRYEPSGNRLYTIEGPYMIHFDDIRGSFLTNPLMTHFFNEINPITRKIILSSVDWSAKSKEALITSDNTLITMNEQVVLKKYNLKNNDITVLNTAQLFVHDKGETVKSDQFVIVRSPPNNILHGTGLIGYPNLGQFTLLDNIESFYETVKK